MPGTAGQGAGRRGRRASRGRPVIYRGEDGRTEQPLVSYTKRPEIAGVLVTAVGAEDARIRLLLLEAVSTVLDVPPHRVQIAARKR